MEGAGLEGMMRERKGRERDQEPGERGRHATGSCWDGLAWDWALRKGGGGGGGGTGMGRAGQERDVVGGNGRNGAGTGAGTDGNGNSNRSGEGNEKLEGEPGMETATECGGKGRKRKARAGQEKDVV